MTAGGSGGDNEDDEPPAGLRCRAEESNRAETTQHSIHRGPRTSLNRSERPADNDVGLYTALVSQLAGGRALPRASLVSLCFEEDTA